MTAISPVSIPSAGQAASPSQPAGVKGTQTAPPVPGQEYQGDILSISSQGLQALEDSKVSLLVLEKHRHRHQEVDLVLLTYPNFQFNGSRPEAVQAPPAVAALGQAGGAGGAAAGGAGHA